MDRVMVNITWKCNLDTCPYCWVKQIVRCNPVLWRTRNHPASEWVTALNRLDPAVFDFVGGEPLAFPHFAELLRGLDPKHHYAVTSNLHHEPGVNAFVVNAAPGQCVHVTGSYHPSGKLTPEQTAERLTRIARAGIPCSVNIIRHESIPNVDELAEWFRDHMPFAVHVSPYEHPADLEMPGEVLLTCEAGRSHYVISNTGDVYPCLSWFRVSGRALRRMGNVFDGTFRKYPERRRCLLRCEMGYVVDKTNSMVAELEIRPS